MDQKKQTPIIAIPSGGFLTVCAIISSALFAVGWVHPLPVWTIAVLVLLTIISLFVFGSIRYRLDKNALTYGMVMIIASDFWWNWWPTSSLKSFISSRDVTAAWDFFLRNFLTLECLDRMIHADIMLFILGLTFFVSVIAQTRILETISFGILKRNRGRVFSTLAILTGIVSFASGILDGVTMIGLMIRTIVIILFLSKTVEEDVIFAVIISTVVTTVCGMWLAYGEPPNLIMKDNLHPHLDNAFFLRYCLPVAVGSYFIVFWNLRKKLLGKNIDMSRMDIIDLHTADVRFLQATNHGKTLTPIEFLEEQKDKLGDRFTLLIERLHQGEPLGLALVSENVPENVRKEILKDFLSEELAHVIDEHYVHSFKGNIPEQNQALQKIQSVIESMHHNRIKTQRIAIFSLVPFIAFLAWHAVDHKFPLFWASFAGFTVAFAGILQNPKMRTTAMKDAVTEYKEYLFLLPLFFSITLLQKTGFFEQLSELLLEGIRRLGTSHVAFIQFTGTTFLSAILDNNVVADFNGRTLKGLETSIIHLFAMAQIAGYALGGCWTHIGSAQSVVAYAFVRTGINKHYTPFQWILAMTPIILEIFFFVTLLVYAEGLLLNFLG